MAGFTPAGTPVTTRISFNSGTLDFGNSRLVNIENIALTISYNLADLYILGSIMPQFKARHSFKVSLTGKLKSYNPEMEMLVLGSSSIGAQNQALALDGQASLTNPVVTLFDANLKEIQYQFTSAVFKSSKLSAKMEDYSEWDFELEALNVSEIYTP